MHWYVITNSILLLQKKVFVIVPKYPLVPSLPSSPFCVCFTVFYILNRQTEWNELESGYWLFILLQREFIKTKVQSGTSGLSKMENVIEVISEVH